MSGKNDHIDFKLIEDYFSGKMNAEQMHALEMQAQDDPFLYEAMEGYQAHPDGVARMSRLKKNHAASSRSFFGSRTLSIIGIAALVYVVALIIQPDVPEELISMDDVENESYQEVEVVPESIDTFVLADVNEQITPQEIQDNRPLIAQSNDKLVERLEQEPEIIHIEEEPLIEGDFEIHPEVDISMRKNNAPELYLHDLYTVDYREIERENASIHYIKYEFSGLSAEFEDQESEDNQFSKETNVEVPYIDYLRTSMRYFSREQYKRALTRYLTIIEQYPADLNAHFYGALCYYDMRKYDKALEFFIAVQRYETQAGFVAFRQEAKWYQAKTLLKLGRVADAKVVLDAIIAEGLFYAQEAIKLKASL